VGKSTLFTPPSARICYFASPFPQTTRHRISASPIDRREIALLDTPASQPYSRLGRALNQTARATSARRRRALYVAAPGSKLPRASR